MRTEAELKQLALDCVEGKIFHNCMLADTADLRMVFIPLALMDNKQLDDLDASEPHLIFEYLSEASPRGVNGMPSFFSMQCLSKAEFEIFKPMVDELERQRKAFLQPA